MMLVRVHKPYLPTALPLLEMLCRVRSVDFQSGENDVAVVDVVPWGVDEPDVSATLEIAVDRAERTATIKLKSLQ